MPRTSFRQRDLERIFRAAKAIDATVQIDLKTLVVTVLPAKEDNAGSTLGPSRNGLPYGRENWDD